MNSSPAERDIRWIIAPTNYQAFIDSHWQQTPLKIIRNNPDYYGDLFSEPQLEQALYLASKVPGALEQLADDESPHRCRDYAVAMEAFRRGKSLRIDAVQRFSRALYMLCRAMEQDLSCPINVNMYLSPGATRALSRHFDTHDVFVLQIHGKKRWRLFDPPIQLPIESLPVIRGESPRTMRAHRLDHRNQMTEGKDTCVLKDEFVLTSGDFLYLPRGHWHEAEAEPGHISCHLTMGPQIFTYTDLLTVAISRASMHDARLRQSLPPGFATHTNTWKEVEKQFAGIMQDLASAMNENREAALGEIGEIFLRNRRASSTSGILHTFDRASVDDIELTSKVRMKEGLICRVTQSPSEVALNFESTRITLPLAFEPACRFITASRQFTPGEIPGDINDNERVSLVQRLIVDGLLTKSTNTRAAVPPLSATAPGAWLPVRLAHTPKGISIRWLQAGGQSLDEPFLNQSVARLMAAEPRPAVRTSGQGYLKRVAPQIPPSGFIFHISRCGSTLVSNALRAFTGTIVISEPQPVGELLLQQALGNHARDDWEQERNEILKALIAAYGQKLRASDKALVIKFQSWNILFLDVIRKLWPEVPCLVVIRDSIEVMVSCLHQPPGWMAWQQDPARASRIFGWDEKSVVEMSREQFCARALGQFLNTAYRAAGLLKVIDYEDLTMVNAKKIGDFFGLDGQQLDAERLDQEMNTYSKDKSVRQLFEDDSEIKQQQATELMRNASKQWADDAYRTLKAGSPF